MVVPEVVERWSADLLIGGGVRRTHCRDPAYHAKRRSEVPCTPGDHLIEFYEPSSHVTAVFSRLRCQQAPYRQQ